jgi:hypothetical protein
MSSCFLFCQNFKIPSRGGISAKGFRGNIDVLKAFLSARMSGVMNAAVDLSTDLNLFKMHACLRVWHACRYKNSMYRYLPPLYPMGTIGSLSHCQSLA